MKTPEETIRRYAGRFIEIQEHEERELRKLCDNPELFDIAQKLADAFLGNLKSEQDQFFKEATKGDYDHLLTTCMKWFDCILRGWRLHHNCIGHKRDEKGE